VRTKERYHDVVDGEFRSRRSRGDLTKNSKSEGGADGTGRSLQGKDAWLPHCADITRAKAVLIGLAVIEPPPKSGGSRTEPWDGAVLRASELFAGMAL
jgi:hypothetical protein